MRVDLGEIARLRELGLVHVAYDEAADLYLANYTHQAQTTPGAWDEHPYLAQCRGLIYYHDGIILARGFAKFWNLSERPATTLEALLPLGIPEISVKCDGSLGLLFYSAKEGAWRVATRGSFSSDQAQHATQLWRDRYHHRAWRHISHQWTYLFEIIYPANRVVVDYGGRDDLILIGVVDHQTGEELSYERVQRIGRGMHLPVVDVEEHLDWSLLAQMERSNFEGFVLFWPRHQRRVKVKVEEYVRLHRLLSGLNEKTIWEVLRHDDLDETRVSSLVTLRAQVPEESLCWFDETVNALRQAYDLQVLNVYQEVHRIQQLNLDPRDRPQRGQIAAHVKAQVAPLLQGPVWRVLDGKGVSSALWRLVEPRGNSARCALPTMQLNRVPAGVHCDRQEQDTRES